MGNNPQNTGLLRQGADSVCFTTLPNYSIMLNKLLKDTPLSLCIANNKIVAAASPTRTPFPGRQLFVCILLEVFFHVN